MSIGVLEGLDPETRTAVLGALYDAPLVGVCVVGLDGRLIDVNAELARMLGHTRASLVNTHFTELMLPEDRAAGLGNYAGARDAAFARLDVRRTYVRRDGTHLPIRLTGGPVLGADGRPRFFLVLIADATATAALEQASRRSKEDLDVLEETLDGLSADASSDTLLVSATRAACRLGRADGAVLFRAVDDDLVEAASHGLDAHAQMRLSPSRGDRSLAALARRTGERQTSLDLVRDGRAARGLVRATGARAALFEPVGVPVSAVLVLLWRRPAPEIVDVDPQSLRVTAKALALLLRG